MPKNTKSKRNSRLKALSRASHHSSETSDVNKFERRNNASTHKPVLGKRVRGGERNVAAARSAAVARRDRELRPALETAYKANEFIDRRFGEAHRANGTDISEEDKMLQRFKKQRLKQLKKAGKFNLEEQETTVLTHMGRALGDSTFGRSNDDDSANEYDSDMDAEAVQQLHFGGQEAQEGEQNRSYKEIMAEVIQKSKERKLEAKKEKLRQQAQLASLDDELDNVQSLLSEYSRTKPKSNDNNRDVLDSDADETVEKHTSGDSKSTKQSAADAKGSSATKQKDTLKKNGQDSEYDSLVALLAKESRVARATDRTKTAEEIASEELHRLQELEALRRARMQGSAIDTQAQRLRTDAYDSEDEEGRQEAVRSVRFGGNLLTEIPSEKVGKKADDSSFAVSVNDILRQRADSETDDEESYDTKTKSNKVVGNNATEISSGDNNPKNHHEQTSNILVDDTQEHDDTESENEDDADSIREDNTAEDDDLVEDELEFDSDEINPSSSDDDDDNDDEITARAATKSTLETDVGHHSIKQELEEGISRIPTMSFNEMPFVFECPTSLSSWLELVQQYCTIQFDTIQPQKSKKKKIKQSTSMSDRTVLLDTRKLRELVRRVYACNNVHISPQNRQKLVIWYKILLRYIRATDGVFPVPLIWSTQDTESTCNGFQHINRPRVLVTDTSVASSVSSSTTLVDGNSSHQTSNATKKENKKETADASNASCKDEMASTSVFAHAEALLPHLHTLTRLMTRSIVQVWQDQICQMRQRFLHRVTFIHPAISETPIESTKQTTESEDETTSTRGLGPCHPAWGRYGDILLCKVATWLFPVTDFQHAILSPLTQLIGQIIANCPVVTLSDVCRGISYTTILCEMTLPAGRIAPEAITFLQSVLSTCIDASVRFNLGQTIVLPMFGLDSRIKIQHIARRLARQHVLKHQNTNLVLPGQIFDAQKASERYFQPLSWLPTWASLWSTQFDRLGKEKTAKHAKPTLDNSNKIPTISSEAFVGIPFVQNYKKTSSAVQTTAAACLVSSYRLIEAIVTALAPTNSTHVRHCDAFPELLQQITDSLSCISEQIAIQKDTKAKLSIPQVSGLFNNLHEYIERIVKGAARSVKLTRGTIHLQERLDRPLALATFEPEYEENFTPHNLPSTATNSQRIKAENRALQRAVKREQRGAARELRLDAQYTARIRAKQDAQRDAEKAAKYKEVMHMLQDQQATFNQMVKTGTTHGGGAGAAAGGGDRARKRRAKIGIV